MTTTDFGGKFEISFPRSKPINFPEFISPWQLPQVISVGGL